LLLLTVIREFTPKLRSWEWDLNRGFVLFHLREDDVTIWSTNPDPRGLRKMASPCTFQPHS
jgi:hypothetical protein